MHLLSKAACIGDMWADMNEQSSSEALSAVIQSVFEIETKALTAFAHNIQKTDIENAVALIHATSGAIIIAGIGKSGHIARKMASTLRSLGKRSVFLHAAEASHGDLGIIERHSTVVVLSNSGETSELSDLLHYCQAQKIPVIALTANGASTLGRCARHVIAYGSHPEACRNGLAPTTSTTLQLVTCDALCVGVSHLMDFQPEDFRQYHPGGRLGARLLKVGQIMHRGPDLPIVAPDAPIGEIVVTMTEKTLGAVLVMADGHLRGIITDGDLRRNIDCLFELKAEDLASCDPITIPSQSTVDQAVEAMNDNGITVIVVKDDATGELGLVHMHQCLNIS